MSTKLNFELMKENVEENNLGIEKKTSKGKAFQISGDHIQKEVC